MKYTVIKTIEFEKEKHCLRCPLRDEATDGCKLQTDGAWAEYQQLIEFENWEEQMKDCPLVEVGGAEDEIQT